MNSIIIIIFFQIIIESFPVSSSGHILLIEGFLYKIGFAKLSLPEYFDYFLHGPTVLILIVLFRKEWLAIIKQIIFRPTRKLFKILFKIFTYACITTFVAIVFKLFIDNFLKQYNGFGNKITLLIGFCITATLLLLLLLKEYNSKRRVVDYEALTLNKVVIIAFVQALALLPGISRFGSVYVVSRLLNVSPRRAFEFTFLIQLPLIIPAFFVGAFKMLKHQQFNVVFSFNVFCIFLIATFIAYFALRFMQQLAYKKRIGLFCFYMLIPIFILICWM